MIPGVETVVRTKRWEPSGVATATVGEVVATVADVENGKKYEGRIVRVAHNGTRPPERLAEDLIVTSPEECAELIEALKHVRDYFRRDQPIGNPPPAPTSAYNYPTLEGVAE